MVPFLSGTHPVLFNNPSKFLRSGPSVPGKGYPLGLGDGGEKCYLPFRVPPTVLGHQFLYGRKVFRQMERGTPVGGVGFFDKKLPVPDGPEPRIPGTVTPAD